MLGTLTRANIALLTGAILAGRHPWARRYAHPPLGTWRAGTRPDLLLVAGRRW